MKANYFLNRATLVVLLGLGLCSNVVNAKGNYDDDVFHPPGEAIEEQIVVNDPFESWNRLWFDFNDGLYTLVLRPVALGYSAVVPEGGRVAVADFFHNLLVPVRVGNDLLQGKGERAVVEIERFGINTVLGALGFIDVAEIHFQLQRNDEDLGQTLGFHGFAEGPYLVWPVLGPSNARDTVGMVGDTFLSPLHYVPKDDWVRVGIDSYRLFNKVSLRVEEYDNMKANSLDYYVAMRHAYTAHRNEKIGR